LNGFLPRFLGRRSAQLETMHHYVLVAFQKMGKTHRESLRKRRNSRNEILPYDSSRMRRTNGAPLLDSCVAISGES
jgi:hypothetical protein